MRPVAAANEGDRLLTRVAEGKTASAEVARAAIDELMDAAAGWQKTYYSAI